MDIGLFFGSFNPIHTGHLIIANFILNNFYVKEVWFVISPHNPFKDQRSLLNEHHRLHLLKTAINDQKNLKANDIEFKLNRPSYTIDTITYLKEKYPNHSFKIIIGSDSLQNINHWKNSKKLISENFFLVYERLNFSFNPPNLNFEKIEAPIIDISATYIRKCIKEKKSIRFLVCDTVFKEISEFGYYR